MKYLEVLKLKVAEMENKVRETQNDKNAYKSRCSQLEAQLSNDNQRLQIITANY
jgi:phage shock protein A